MLILQARQHGLKPHTFALVVYFRLNRRRRRGCRASSNSQDANITGQGIVQVINTRGVPIILAATTDVVVAAFLGALFAREG